MKRGENSSSVKISKQAITPSYAAALGYRNPAVTSQGPYGYYWSSLSSNASNAYYLNWNTTNAANMTNTNKSYGMPVRCVQEFIRPVAFFRLRFIKIKYKSDRDSGQSPGGIIPHGAYPINSVIHRKSLIGRMNMANRLSKYIERYEE